MIHENAGRDKSKRPCHGVVDKHPFKKENEDRCLTSVIINILMMLSEPL